MTVSTFCTPKTAAQLRYIANARMASAKLSRVESARDNLKRKLREDTADALREDAYLETEYSRRWGVEV